MTWVIFIYRRLLIPVLGLVAFYGAGCSGNDPVNPSAVGQNLREPSTPLATGFTVFASGLNNPRGLEFGPDGYLYVAEGGAGGSESTVGQCEQVPAPVGPYTGSPDGSRISRVGPDGVVSTVIDGLPSSQTSTQLGSLVSGVADIAFIEGTLYALISGAGCSHGVAGTSNGVIRVNNDGTWTQIANLSEYYQTHPVADPEEEDFEPDGNPYSMIAVRGLLAVVESNHGAIDWVIPSNGAVRRILDISESQGHIVPTAVAYRGKFYVGNLGSFPIDPGAQKVLSINQSGRFQVPYTGLTAVVGLAFGPRGQLYVLEASTGPGEPAPGTGTVVRIGRNGAVQTVVTGLTFPTAMTFGPEGEDRLYISNFGFGFPPGRGEVVIVEVPGEHEAAS